MLNYRYVKNPTQSNNIRLVPNNGKFTEIQATAPPLQEKQQQQTSDQSVNFVQNERLEISENSTKTIVYKKEDEIVCTSSNTDNNYHHVLIILTETAAAFFFTLVLILLRSHTLIADEFITIATSLLYLAIMYLSNGATGNPLILIFSFLNKPRNLIRCLLSLTGQFLGSYLASLFALLLFTNTQLIFSTPYIDYDEGGYWLTTFISETIATFLLLVSHTLSERKSRGGAATILLFPLSTCLALLISYPYGRSQLNPFYQISLSLQSGIWSGWWCFLIGGVSSNIISFLFLRFFFT